MIAGSMDGSHALLRIDDDGIHVVQSFHDHTKFVIRVRFSSCGNFFASASRDRSVCVYNFDGKFVQLLKKFEFDHAVEAVVFSPVRTLAFFLSFSLS